MFFTFKALHLIGMVCWFAGLFYMFRLFVYLRENHEKKETADVLKVMAHKLFYYITWPSMVVTLIFGVALLGKVPAHATSLWFTLKLGFLFLLIMYHLFIGKTLKRFKADDYFLTSKQCRLLNELPVIALIAIVFLAVFKPL